jgi:hypothetical protein
MVTETTGNSDTKTNFARMSSAQRERLTAASCGIVEIIEQHYLTLRLPREWKKILNGAADFFYAENKRLIQLRKGGA